jgi:hypothetical protein
MIANNIQRRASDLASLNFDRHISKIAAGSAFIDKRSSAPSDCKLATT